MTTTRIIPKGGTRGTPPKTTEARAAGRVPSTASELALAAERANVAPGERLTIGAVLFAGDRLERIELALVRVLDALVKGLAPSEADTARRVEVAADLAAHQAAIGQLMGRMAALESAWSATIAGVTWKPLTLPGGCSPLVFAPGGGGDDGGP